MTPEELEKIDHKILEQVFNCTLKTFCGPYGGCSQWVRGDHDFVIAEEGGFRPTTSIRDAMKTFDKAGLRVLALDDEANTWSAWRYGIRIDEPPAHEDRCVAICLGALAAIGVEV